jgi:hypothetical protein
MMFGAISFSDSFWGVSLFTGMLLRLRQLGR